MTSPSSHSGEVEELGLTKIETKSQSTVTCKMGEGIRCRKLAPVGQRGFELFLGTYLSLMKTTVFYAGGSLS